MNHPKENIIIGTFHKYSKKKRGVYFVTAMALLLAVSIIVAAVSQDKPKDKTTPSNSEQSVVLPEVMVTITASGFVPETVSVKKGQTVTWTNNDSAPHQISTDPHPLDDGLEGFKASAPTDTNNSFGFTFEKLGTFTYHDELNPDKFKGTVIVE